MFVRMRLKGAIPAHRHTTPCHAELRRAAHELLREEAQQRTAEIALEPSSVVTAVESERDVAWIRLVNHHRRVAEVDDRWLRVHDPAV